ncbi:hypothetical protein NDI56_16230 [Haloarcula sp. S1CR25-12]|uniref:Uncharacterized protein n=1 Tax=Haloarcula saliterrae TaxID=2950534 RepID=A0ABU2FGI2_9EURY|nr:hypothetical protein [Haloarcula sp. S1CR25-12]MDS0260950.1 hypothetical protein [Haloarcula sp. S1CR25-12]
MGYTMHEPVGGEFDQVVQRTSEALDSMATAVRDRFGRLLSTVGNESR